MLSPSNQVLLLHRVKTSKSFAAAHVFPGGNLDSFHDGAIPAAGSPDLHVDSPAYRLGAIRECFEETGILLARPRDEPSAGAALLAVPDADRDAARKRIHGGEVRFGDWVESVGGVPDVERLLPFTRWITPKAIKGGRRFTTQMYLYMIPDAADGTAAEAARQREMIVPTPDGGVEHTAARFDDATSWLEKARSGELILFPPQVYLLHLVAQFCSGAAPSSPREARAHYASQREKLVAFLQKVPTSDSGKAAEHPTSTIPWSDKVMSPRNLFVRSSDDRIVLGVDAPGPELKGTGRGGDHERVVLVSFTHEGPRRVEIMDREEAFREERETPKL